MILALAFQIAAATVAPDTSRLSPTLVIAEQQQQQQDTTRRRRPRAHAVEYSEAYNQRLLIHRWASYAMIPVFAAQYYAGQKLYDAEKNGTEKPDWAKSVHGVGAASIAGLFGINTLTGAWNLWDSRHTPEHRWLRYSHSVIMLGADAAFAYTGIKLAEDADQSQQRRDDHRRVAIYAMGVSTASGIIMKVFNK